MPTKKFIDPETFDKSVKPGDDFFQYINGKWIKENPIPAEEARWGSFTVLDRAVEAEIKGILEEATKKDNVPVGSELQKIRDFYLTAMDVAKLNKLRVEPLQKLFGKLDAMQNPSDFMRVSAELHRCGVGVFWQTGVAKDIKSDDILALHLWQGGLSLPTRDYYLNDDVKSAEIRTKHLTHISNVFKSALKVQEHEKEAQIAVSIETALAKNSRTPVELRDIEKQYNKFVFNELLAMTPHLDWKLYFETLRLPLPGYVIVGQPEFFKEVDRLWETLSLSEIKKYMLWQILSAFADFLDEDMERASFDFYGRTFGGATEMKPRWRRVQHATSAMLDHALGRLYVEKYFGGKAKQVVNELTDRMVVAYRMRIEKLSWMEDETKKKALIKLDRLGRKMGYPDKWKDWSKLEIRTESYADNYMRICAFEFDRQAAKLGQKIDRSEWDLAPQIINAFNEPVLNQIVFPAAILQPPFFYPDADPAVNLGGIGAVIGHELTHSFDDQGAQFNEKGDLQNWWTEDDKKRFEAKLVPFVKQFNETEILPGLFVNGQLTLGENVADLGGLAIAFDALQAIVREQDGGETIDGLTPAQRFFASFASIWRNSEREEFLRMLIATNEHPPHAARVNNTLSNLGPFYEAFDIKPGDKLWRESEKRSGIW